MTQSTQERNKTLVLQAFDLLFNQRDYAAAETYWSPHYIQHSAHIAPGREGLFDLIKSLPSTLKYEPGTIVAEGDVVIVHGRFSGFGAPVNWIAADIVRIEDGILIEHWDVIQDEASRESSKSGFPCSATRLVSERLDWLFFACPNTRSTARPQSSPCTRGQRFHQPQLGCPIDEHPNSCTDRKGARIESR